MHIHRLSTSCLSFIARSVVSLSEHHGEIAHSRFPFLRHSIGFRGKREGVFAFGVGKTFGKIGYSIVQCETSYGQLRFFRLLFLVFSCTLFGTPFIFLLLVHFVHLFHFRSPSIYYGINTSFTRCEITGDIADEVQRVHLSVHAYLHACSEHSDDRTDSSNHWHCQCRTHSTDRITHAQRHLGQSVEIEHFVLGISLVQCIHQSLVLLGGNAVLCSLFQFFLSQSVQYILQAFRHLRDFLIECRVDASHLFLIRETIVAGNHLSHQIAIETADMTEIYGKFKSQCITIGTDWFLTVIIHLPPFGDNV